MALLETLSACHTVLNLAVLLISTHRMRIDIQYQICAIYKLPSHRDMFLKSLMFFSSSCEEHQISVPLWEQVRCL